MTPTLWIAATAMLAAAVALAGVGLLLRGRRVVPLEEAEATTAAAAAIPGFAARQALVGDDRRTALVVGENGRVALVAVRGKRPEAREVRWSDIRAVAGGLRVEGERPVLVEGVDVLDVRRAGDEGWRRR